LTFLRLILLLCPRTFLLLEAVAMPDRQRHGDVEGSQQAQRHTNER